MFNHYHVCRSRHCAAKLIAILIGVSSKIGESYDMNAKTQATMTPMRWPNQCDCICSSKAGIDQARLLRDQTRRLSSLALTSKNMFYGLSERVTEGQRKTRERKTETRQCALLESNCVKNRSNTDNATVYNTINPSLNIYM